MIVLLTVYEILDSEMQKSLQRIRLYKRSEPSSGSLRWWLDSAALTMRISRALSGSEELFHTTLFWH